MRVTHQMEGFPWDDLRKIFNGCQRMTKVPNGVKMAENFNRLSRVHEHYRRQTDTDGRATAYSERDRAVHVRQKSYFITPDCDELRLRI